MFAIETRHLSLTVGADGHTAAFVDRATGADGAAHAPFAHWRRGETWYPARAAADLGGGRLRLEFEGGGHATLAASARGTYLVFEVVAVDGTGAQGAGVDELAFVDLPLTGGASDSFPACALALDLSTRVAEIPGLGSAHLRASSFARFGLAGARTAIVAAPRAHLRAALQDVVRADLRLPWSTIGGPFALDAGVNRGSYLFNFDGPTLAEVDGWIAVIRSLGFDQLDFHGGRSFRFGDCRPNPERYPNGMPDLKAVIDRLHAAGIKAGLHTYAFFIDRTCPWVTPVPDPRLGKDASFTLAAPLAAAAGEPEELHVDESTAQMSAITGFFVRNSVTLLVDDELITYSGVGGHGFTGCQRGAWGTRAAAHAKGAPVHHLRECFGLFAPDPESGLLEEVAASHAATYNACGFDMIYLDALDGEDVLAGADVGWHYGSRFALELWRRLERPALMEMSTFHHHLWYVRSRMGAWDHPQRSHKRFIDLHVDSNRACDRMFLPGNLGWWAFKTWSGPEGEPTFADDIEYWCAKALGTGSGLSLMGIDPTSAPATPALPRLAAIVRRWEELRRSGRVSESVRARLAQPGAEFSLEGEGNSHRFRPLHSQRHKVECLEDWSRRWRADNPHGAQTPAVRIEALLSAGAYDEPGHPVLADFEGAAAFAVRQTAADVAVHLEAPAGPVRAGGVSGCLRAVSARADRRGAWARVGRAFDPPLDLAAHPAMGVWVHGDGNGQVLNLQLRSPEHLSHAVGDHYVVVDFTGWRYVELVEPEGEAYARYEWPYGSPYAIYRESVRPAAIGSLDLWLNDLPAGGTATCYLSPVRGLALRPARLSRPRLTIGGRTVEFPVSLDSGAYLEWQAPACTVYGPKGQVLQELEVAAGGLRLGAGGGAVEFDCDPPEGGVRPRARVTLFARGEPLSG